MSENDIIVSGSHKDPFRQRATHHAYLNPSYRSSSFHSIHSEQSDDADDQQDQLPQVNSDRYSRNVMILDAAMLILEYLQVFALIMSMSLRWPWPATWTSSFSFVFIFNLDFWEMVKRSSGVYIPARDYYVPSDAVSINYGAMLIVWLVALIGLSIAYFVLRWYFTVNLRKKWLNMLNCGVIVTVQALSFPVGVQIAKVFWCTSSMTSVMDVDNLVICSSGAHWAYIIVGVIVLLLLFVVYPLWQARLIYNQLVSKDAKKHETYLRLKHFEQIYDLDRSWVHNLFFNFASFNRFWAYFRPINHVLKLLILIFYGAMFNLGLVQSGMIFATYVILLMMSLIVHPYRVTSYSLLHSWCLLCLCCNLVIGLMQNIPDIQSVFLLPSYIQGELILINAAWLVGCIFGLVYIALRHNRLVCVSFEFWPYLFKQRNTKLSKVDRGLILAAVNGRKVLKMSTNMPALLAPVHLLSFHIEHVNKKVIQADRLNNPLRSTLRGLLDELIEAYNRYAPFSIFSESKKNRVHSTAAKLMKALPDFTARLQQREYDLILVSAKKRRLLLKMFAVSCFVRNASRHTDDRQRSHYRSGVRKLWNPSGVEGGFDEGFHEDDSCIDIENITVHERSHLVAGGTEVSDAHKSRHTRYDSTDC